MKIFYRDLIHYLESNKIKHTVISNNLANLDMPYIFASLKSVVDYGLYYFEGDYKLLSKNINNSLILTSNISSPYVSSNIYVIVDKPQLIHYQFASFILKEDKKVGIHKTAIISPKAQISKKAYIGPFCVIEDCIIEDGVQLLSSVTIKNNVLLKKNTIIEGNSVIGARGMAWIWDENGSRVIQPQIGGVVIEANCIIGTDISIVRGSLNENTLIGYNTIIAHGSKIGHGCKIGNNVHIANNVSLAGNANIGNRSFLGSACTVSSNVRIGTNCIVGAGAVVSKSIDAEYATIVGVPAKVIKLNNFENKPKGAPKPHKNN